MIFVLTKDIISNSILKYNLLVIVSTFYSEFPVFHIFLIGSSNFSSLVLPSMVK